MPDRLLFTVRAGEGTFRVVTSNPREAVELVGRLVERGLEDVNVTDLNGKRYETTELEKLAETSPNVDAA